MNTLLKLCAAPLLALTNLSADPAAHQALWSEVLGPPRGLLPPDPDPGKKVVWRSDFTGALAEAKRANRPLFVTWRCLPCKQCASFDKDVLEGSETLDPLLRRFVTVRLTDASQLDERFFPYRTHQDLDLSWWAYFLSPDGDLYGVFGGKDHVSDSTRISEAALVNSLQRALTHHHDPRRKEWGIDLPNRHATQVRSGPKDSRGYELLLKMRPELAKPHPQHGTCLHCHQVGDMLTLESLHDGSFQVEELTGKWPLPENLGLHLDRDDGLLVTAVDPDSPAAAAGLRPQDRLGMAGGLRLLGQADFRGVLHRAGPGPDLIPLAWRRNDDIHFGTIKAGPGWRKTENWWRKTVYDGVFGPGMGFFPLAGPKYGKGQGLSVKAWMGPKPKERPVFGSGLRPNMEIIAINGMEDDLEIRKLITWFRLNHRPGDEVVFKVRGGKDYRYRLPEEK